MFSRSDSEERAEFSSWGEDGFDHLRKYTRNGSEFFKEVIGVLEERVELQEHYAKGLQKLSARLMKATKNAVGALDAAWKFVAAELENEAAIHRNLGAALEEEIVKPLKTVQTAHHKTRKTIETTVEKSIKHASSRRSAQEKAKKTSHHLAADLEKVTKVSAQETHRPSKTLSEKQAAKLSSKRTKLEENSACADQAYHDSAIASESQRQHSELVLTAAALRIETLEETRLANLQTALGRYHCHLSQLGPGLTNACTQQFQTRIDPLLSVDVRQDLALIVSQSQPSQQAFRTLVLCDFYAEDFSSPMAADRRREALTRYLGMFEKDLEREKRGKQKLDQLSTLYEEYPLFSDVQTKMTLKDKVTDRLAMLNFLDYHTYKIRCSLASLDKAPVGTLPTNEHELSKYENKLKDKMGLRQTHLRIPLPVARITLPTQRRPSLYAVSHYEKRQAGDGQSPPRKQPDDDISESPYENLDTESIIDTFSETSSSARTETCQALYDFEPQQQDQLAIYAGDVIRITEKTTREWWQGELLGRVGLFPANYVKEL